MDFLYSFLLIIVIAASIISIVSRVYWYSNRVNSERSPEKDHPDHSDHVLANPES